MLDTDKTIDLKVQIPENRVPPLIMAVLKKGPGKFGVNELINAAHDSGMKVTVVIDQPGAMA